MFEWIAAHWLQILAITTGIMAVLGAVGKWMKKNEEQWDNKLGDAFIYISDLWGVLFSAIPGIVKKDKGSKLPVIFLCLFLGAMPVLNGCGAQHMTATQQLLQQTDDPAIIAKGAYFDAAAAYRNAQKLYLPYQALMEKNHPTVAKSIHDAFQKANDIRNRWKSIGTIPSTDSEEFYTQLRYILLGIGEYIDNGGLK